MYKGERKGKRKPHFRFDSAEPHPIFYKYSEISLFRHDKGTAFPRVIQSPF